MERIYPLWLAVTGGITFLAYGFDKVQSKTEGRRVPEAVLHGLAIAGGFGGGWLGRWVFRHKTRKGFFTLVLVASTMAHLGLGYWLLFR
jgi:uncharacterized membrane protein YsdA (DUF1294 family)